MHLDAQIAAMRAALGSAMIQPQPLFNRSLFELILIVPLRGENPGAASGEPRGETKMKGDCGF